MKIVSKYNTFKGVSTVLTVGTPIVTLACCGGLFKDSPASAISAAGIFAILITLLFCKDKLAENFKFPSAFIISAVVLILVILIEHITKCIKIVCFATIITSGVDELTFKKFYKLLEMKFPDNAKQFKHFGFYFITTKKLMEANDESRN